MEQDGTEDLGGERASTGAANEPSATGHPVDWRPVVAALANRDARAVWAKLVVDGGGTLSPARERRARELLDAAGLIRTTDGGAVEVADAAFRELLAASASLQPRPTGVERFLRPDGRIDRFPAAADDRSQLLRHIAGRVIAVGEIVTERELTERLARFGDDPVTLRRYLVDAGILLRTRSGSEYARGDEPSGS
ncbi:DUF2087 domain-containing protein [Leifsonia shinshuensis]|uniref:DUF2087 domain-containing protein n=1 Tax=Leifsonia shinshuensis TaxID=150026 RepID=UPI002857212F|nr:DUF2087 domain-containing protein [Leifsonia shinshuensis]MDR6972195.1 hypothetical protein [Leifsonia shinshuensis]